MERRVLKNFAQVFFCEFCEIFKNIFFTEHLWTTAFDPGYYLQGLENCSPDYLFF